MDELELSMKNRLYQYSTFCMSHQCDILCTYTCYSNKNFPMSNNRQQLIDCVISPHTRKEKEKAVELCDDRFSLRGRP